MEGTAEADTARSALATPDLGLSFIASSTFRYQCSATAVFNNRGGVGTADPGMKELCPGESPGISERPVTARPCAAMVDRVVQQ